jgi:radical SAM protein with 4Fe4S-binding SPASM domain
MMGSNFISTGRLPEFGLWEQIHDKRIPLDFELELTARCNNDCRHCYINLPAGDLKALRGELSLSEISDIADQAVELGALWCLITGGEPLLRKDFFDVYLMLKKKGLLLSLFTNACLVSEDHIQFLKKYPPRDIEVSVYGATAETYENVTRKPGSYAAFRRGLDLLLGSGIEIKLKAMVLRSNVHELPEIAAFCRMHSQKAFRFDPMLHLRYDNDPIRNKEILAERLTPEEIVAIEQADELRLNALKQNCDHYIFPHILRESNDQIFRCAAGRKSFTVSYDGIFRLCADLWHPDTVYDLRKGTLAEAWAQLVPKVRNLRSDNPEYLQRCRNCQITNLCFWCPAHAFLDCGELDCMVEYYCEVAHARAAALEAAMKDEGQ